jgi:hypothetical protein
MLIVSILQYLLLALIVNRGIDSRISFSRLLVYFYLTTFTLNIFISQILSLFSQLNNRFLYFGLQTALVALLLFLVMRKFQVRWADLLPQNNHPAEKTDFLSGLMIGLASLSFLALLIIGIRTPPNNLDSMQTHLVRIYYWLQHGNFLSWASNTYTQLVYPINANIQALWLFLMGQNENLFFLVSWSSLAIIASESYQITRELNLSRHQALATLLVLLTIPAAVLQTYSFQNDLAVVALIMTFITFFLIYQRTHQLNYLIVSLLGLALALGVKQTAFMVLPALLLWVLYTIITHKIEKRHLPHLSWLLVFFLLFSSYQYIQNMSEFGSFFGVSDVTFGQTLTVTGLLQKAEYNVPRYLYGSLSVDGLPDPLATPLTNVKADVFRALTKPFHLDLEKEVFLQPGYDASEKFSYSTLPALTEDTAGPGPLSILLIIVAFFIVLLGKDKKRKEYLVFSLVLSVSYFSAILIQRPGWDPYQGRYFILAIIPAIPLTGLCLSKIKPCAIFQSILLICIYLLIGFNILFFNSSKPIITASTNVYWQNSYILKLPTATKTQQFYQKGLTYISTHLSKFLLQRQSIFDLPYYDQLYYTNINSSEEIEFVEQNISPDTPLYLMISPSSLEYGLFGINRTRELFPITSPNQVPVEGILLIENQRKAPPANFSLIRADEILSLYQREN